MVKQSPSGAGGRKEMWVLRAANMLRGTAMLGILLAGALWAASLHSSGTGNNDAAEATVAGSPERFGTSSTVPSSWTFYVVGSEDEAMALRDVLEQGNAIRNSVGLDPMHERVLVAMDPVHARLLVEQLHEGNAILASFAVEDRVVNLVI